MTRELRAIKGTRDILPGEVEVWQRAEEAARRTFALYGYREIRTPLIEPTELFQKSTGSDTDIVTKEMYTFLDRAGRSVTLRPEGTPGVVRAALEHAMVDRGEIQRLYYIGPMFRYERPQKGRYRQFSQIGAEVFGSASPATDAEVMQMALALFASLGLGETPLQINSVGHPVCRDAYKERLRAFFEPRRAALCEDCQRRLDTNPLRILDCKVPSCAQVRQDAPSILDSLCDDCRAHFDEVRRDLEVLEVPHTVNPRLVRGLDYYTRTTFEISSSALGAQDALCGGGRYDGLVGSMGGPSVPGIGFAIGHDRLVLAMSSTSQPEPATDVYIVHRGEKTLSEGLLAATRLREAGLAARLEPDARDVKKQMSKAAASGARFALIIGERELEEGTYALKRMSDGTQRSIAARRWAQIEQEVRDGR